MSPNIPSHPVESTSSSYAHQLRMRQQQQQQTHPAIYSQHHQHHATHLPHHPHQHHSNPTQSRSSPKEFFPIATSLEGTPKLPPKPSLSANFYNNPGECYQLGP